MQSISYSCPSYVNLIPTSLRECISDTSYIIVPTIIVCRNFDMKSCFEHVLIFILIDIYFCRRLVVDFEQPIYIENLYRKLNKAGTDFAIESVLRMDNSTRSDLCDSILRSKFFSDKGIVPASKHIRQLQETARYYLGNDYELHFLPGKTMDLGRIRSIFLVVDHMVTMPSSGTDVVPLLPCLGMIRRTLALEEYFVSDGFRGDYHFIFHKNDSGNIVPVAMTEKCPLEQFINSPEKLEKFYADQRQLFGVPSEDISTFAQDEKWKIAQLIFQSSSYLQISLIVHGSVEEKKIQFMTPGFEAINWSVNVIQCTIEAGRHKSTRYIGGGFVKNSIFVFRKGDRDQVIIDSYFIDVIVLNETNEQ